MSTLIFYEKPGCANNARQKLLLKNAGHEVVARNLLDEPWTAERLRAFFGELPVPDWFNRAAPRVKSGEIVPERLDADTALALMLAEPLLIRRPLMECGGKRIAGFDAERVAAWIGAPRVREEHGDLQTCRRDAK
jgi:nitrogenase-associated protein